MPTPTYATVAPLVQDLQVQGRSVRLRFVCPRSGNSVSVQHTASPSASSALTRQMKSTVSRSLMYSLRSTISSIIRGIFGRGMFGRVAADLASTAMYQAGRSTTQRAAGLSQGDQEDAIVRAFEGVQSQFVWDSDGNGWVSLAAAQQVMGGFQRQLAEHPVLHPYDRQVLARMLVEVAKADGRVSPEEATWLTEMITADQGGVDDVARRPPLTIAELRSTSPGPERRTLLMLAHALAFVDENLDPKEVSTLQRFGAGLDLDAREQATIAADARTWVLDQALERMSTWGGHDEHARQQLYQLAGRLGMSQQEAEQAEARYLRRAAR